MRSIFESPSLSPKKRSIKTCQTGEIVVAIMEDKITFPEEKLVPRHFQNLINVRHVVIFFMFQKLNFFFLPKFTVGAIMSSA